MTAADFPGLPIAIALGIFWLWLWLRSRGRPRSYDIARYQIDHVPGVTDDVARARGGEPSLDPRIVIPRRVYLAGAMTGLPEWNHPAFHRWQAALEADGFEVVSPARLWPDPEHPSVTWEGCMRVNLAHLLECDEVALIPGWEESRGARSEKLVADLCGIPVRFLKES